MKMKIVLKDKKVTVYQLNEATSYLDLGIKDDILLPWMKTNLLFSVAGEGWFLSDLYELSHYKKTRRLLSDERILSDLESISK